MVIDMEELIEQVRIESKINPTEKGDGDEDDNYAINVAKYEVLRLLLDVILTNSEEIDDKMGYKSLDNSGFPFKLALNTLIEYKIIKEVN